MNPLSCLNSTPSWAAQLHSDCTHSHRSPKSQAIGAPKSQAIGPPQEPTSHRGSQDPSHRAPYTTALHRAPTASPGPHWAAGSSGWTWFWFFFFWCGGDVSQRFVGLKVIQNLRVRQKRGWKGIKTAKRNFLCCKDLNFYRIRCQDHVDKQNQIWKVIFWMCSYQLNKICCFLLHYI